MGLGLNVPNLDSALSVPYGRVDHLPVKLEVDAITTHWLGFDVAYSPPDLPQGPGGVIFFPFQMLEEPTDKHTVGNELT